MSKKIPLHIQQLEVLDQDTLLFYKEITSRYPYCQYAHLMFLLNLKKLEDEHSYRQMLPFTAISVPDRIRLKEQVEELETLSEPVLSEKQNLHENIPSKGNRFSPWNQSLPQTDTPENNLQEDPGFRPVVEEMIPEKGEETLLPSDKETSSTNPTVEVLRDLINGRKKNPEPPLSRTAANAIIDRFLQGGEHAIMIDEDFDYSTFDPDTAQSNLEDFSFGSETLAEMYLKNGSPHKAIEVYKHLGLKFPEKNRYFASLIEKVRKEYSIK